MSLKHAIAWTACTALLAVTTHPAHAQVSAIDVVDINDNNQLAFQGASIHSASDSGNIINLTPYTWTSYLPGDAPDNPTPGLFNDDYMWWAFQADHISGENPTFRLDMRDTLFGAEFPSERYPSGYLPVWTATLDSNNQPTDWKYFDNGGLNGVFYDFNMNANFNDDTIYVAQSIPYTSSHVSDLVDRITHPTTGSPNVTYLTGDTDNDYVIATTADGHKDFRGRTVVGQDLYGFAIRDASATPTQQAVIFGGNHADEHIASHNAEGMIEFLASDNPIAELILQDVEFAVYPMVDPEGRDLGHTRGNDSTVNQIDGSLVVPDDITLNTFEMNNFTVLDHNRIWDEVDTDYEPEEVATIRASIATETGNDVEWFFDFHASRPGELTEGKYRASVFATTIDSPTLRTIKPDDSGLAQVIQDLVVDSDGTFAIHTDGISPGQDFNLDPHTTADLWAVSDLNADHSFTPEIYIPPADLFKDDQNQNSVAERIAFIRRYGEFYAIGLAAALNPNTVFWVPGTETDWNSGDAQWVRANQTSAAPSAGTNTFIALDSGQTFNAPNFNTTVGGLELRGYDGGFVFEQNANVLLTSINNPIIINDAEYRITGSNDQTVITMSGPGTGLVIEENGVLNLGRDAGGQVANVNSDLAVAPTGRIVIGIDGSGANEYDRMTVGGNAFLGGELELAPTASSSFLTQENFVVISAGSLVSEPDTVTGHIGDSVFGLATNYTATGVDVELTVQGDANRDGYVNGSDFLIWQRNVGQSTSEWTRGDFNGDGVVGSADLAIWDEHYGLTTVGQNILWHDNAASAPDWATAQWAQDGVTNPTPGPTSSVAIATYQDVTFAAPTVDTEVAKLELRGMGGADLVFEQNADVYLHSVGSQITIDHAEYRIVGSVDDNVAFHYLWDLKDNATLNLGRDAGGQKVFSGDFYMDSTARLVIGIDGNATGEFDYLSVGNEAHLGGTLELAQTPNADIVPYQNFVPIIIDRIWDEPDRVEGHITDSVFALATNYAHDPGVDLTLVLQGDASRDGSVDASDFLIWQQNVGQSTSEWTRGDFNGDGVVGSADLAIWTDRYGLTAGVNTIYWRDTDDSTHAWDDAYWVRPQHADPSPDSTTDVMILSSKAITLNGSATTSVTVNSLTVKGLPGSDLTLTQNQSSQVMAIDDVVIENATYRFESPSAARWLYAADTMTIGPNGTLDLGDETTGQYAIAKHYVQDDTGTLRVTLDADTSSKSDALFIYNGTATIDGTLEITKPATYDAQLADNFTILSYLGVSTFSGEFDQINGVFADAANLLGFAVTYEPGNGGIKAIVSLLGDANLDFFVDDDDVAILDTNFNQPGSWIDGDFNGDGWVNVLDLSLLSANYGEVFLPVPEPAALALLTLGTLALGRRRRNG